MRVQPSGVHCIKGAEAVKRRYLFYINLKRRYATTKTVWRGWIQATTPGVGRGQDEIIVVERCDGKKPDILVTGRKPIRVNTKTPRRFFTMPLCGFTRGAMLFSLVAWLFGCTPHVARIDVRTERVDETPQRIDFSKVCHCESRMMIPR